MSLRRKDQKKKKTEVKEQKERVERKKKVLIATDSYLPRWDGIARFLSEIIPELSDDLDITVIAPKNKGRYTPNKKIKEIRLPLRKIKIGDYTPCVFDKNKVLEEIKNCDIIWTQTIGPIGKNIIHLGKKYSKPVIAYTHSIEWELVSQSINKPLLKEPLKKMTISFARRLYNRCDLIITPSRYISDILQWKKITTKKKIIPLGVNTSKFQPPINKDASKMAINISPKMRVIGFTGRIAYEKDLSTLVRAFVRLKDEYENITLLIVGDGVDELKKRFSKIKGVKLVGTQDDVIPYLQAMDIYVLPSLTETTSLSTLEAMSCEVPPITTPVGDLTHYIVNNVNGFKFSRNNSFELTVRLRKLLDDRKLREKLGKNARYTVVEKFSWKNTVKNIKETLDEFKHG